MRPHLLTPRVVPSLEARRGEEMPTANDLSITKVVTVVEGLHCWFPEVASEDLPTLLRSSRPQTSTEKDLPATEPLADFPATNILLIEVQG